MSEKKTRNPTRVAVIGAGVAGLAAAKYLLAEKVKGPCTRYFDVTVFERHSEVARIWNLTSPTEDDFQTPMHQGLETNVPRTLMTFRDSLYPRDVSLFPTHDKIKDYLERYADEIRHCIKLGSEVTKNFQRKRRVEAASDPKGSGLKDNDSKGGKTTLEYFDTIVVTTGTFHTYHIPSELELDAWKVANPESVGHSGDFRDAKAFERKKKVLMIGGGSSYFDIAKRISPCVKGDILVSTNHPLPMLSSKNQWNLSKIDCLLPEERSVFFIDGEIEYDIDAIILCAGYKYEYPFLPSLKIDDDGKMFFDVWKQIFWVADPTLAFVGLPTMSAIFTVAEAQSALIALAWSGRIALPYAPTQRKELEISMEDNTPKESHRFNYPKDKEYINELSEACREADRQENGGKTPPLFDAYFDWTRKNLGAMRTAFFEKGEERHRFTSPSL